MKIFKTHTALLIWRILLLYVVLMLCRILFYRYNSEIIGPIDGSELGALLRGALMFDNVSVLYANALFILLSLVPLRLRDKKWWQSMMYWYYVVVNSLLLVVLNLSDAVYFRYAQKRLTAEELLFAENDNSLQLFFKFLSENLPVALVGIALIVLLAVGYCRRCRPQSLLLGVWYYLSSTIILIIAMVLSIGGIRGGFTKMTRPITLSNATLYTPDNMRATMILSNPFCVLRTMGSSGKLHYQRYFEPEKLTELYSPEHYPSADTRATELTGRNVVLFVMESFSAEHSALLSPQLYKDEQQKGYTPFLDSLMRQSYTFFNMYSNGKRSIQALPAVWSSIPSLKTSFISMPQAMAPMRALPELLAEEGYRTMFFCGSNHGSMGFGAYARQVGVKELYSRENYEQAHGKEAFDGYWGIWDEEFMQYMGEVLSEAEQPFFSTMFTLTSHHPFVIPERYAGEFPEGKTAVHKCVGYVDEAFRRFFARYENEEWFRNTLFVFVADHVSSEKFSEEFRHSPADYRIFGFMYAPDSALFGEHRQVVSQIDIMPTMLGLMGYNKPYFAFGRDVFGEHRDIPMAVNYDNNLFQAITKEFLVTFDENEIVGVYAKDDITLSNNLVGEVDMAEVERDLKAFIQSYYARVEAKDYLADDTVPEGEPEP
jgi:phosphoglycerol transferase MdoB-like AlkP superfamily enzyme